MTCFNLTWHDDDILTGVGGSQVIDGHLTSEDTSLCLFEAADDPRTAYHDASIQDKMRETKNTKLIVVQYVIRV